MASWLTPIPRSWSRSSTFRRDSGKRTYNITAKLMISGDVLNYRKGLGFVIPQGYATALPCSSKFNLTMLSGRLTICSKTGSNLPPRLKIPLSSRDRHYNNRTTRTEGLIGTQNSHNMHEMAFYLGNVGLTKKRGDNCAN